MDKTIVLKVDGQDIPMNPFVRELFINVVNGLVNSLDKIPEGKKKIELFIENKGGK